MTARLPNPGGDDGSWGDVLNDFLEVGHNSDGTNKGVITGFTSSTGKTLTVDKTITLTSADDTSVITLPSSTKTLLATDGSAASLTNFPNLNQDTTGNADTASALATSRAINGINFDGTAPITVPSNIVPGSSGYVMTSNGSVWTSAPAPGGSTPAVITVANEASDTTCFPLFATGATGNLSPKTNAVFTFNAVTGLLTAASLISTSSIALGAVSGATGSILLNGLTSGTVTVKPKDTAGTYTLTLPDTDGDPDQFMKTDGSGNLSWAASATSIARATSNVTSSSLATDATDATKTLPLGKMCTLYRIETDRAAWVRVYSSDAFRTADVARTITTDPTGESGILLEVITAGDNLILDLTPAVFCWNSETTPGPNIYLAITNKGSVGTVTVTLSYVPIES